MKRPATTNIEALEILIAETEAAIAAVNAGTGPTPRIVDPADESVTQSPLQPRVESNTTEIVIDLPHGQTLTVKGLEQGAIVEIASWRGVGPPGDDAVRMMFGANRTPAATEEIGGEATENTGYTPVERIETSGETGTADVRSRQRITTKGTTMWKKLAIIGAIVVLGGVVIAALRLTNLVLFEHPDGGLTGGLGPASSTFVAVSPSAALEPNASVIVTVDNRELVAGVVEVGENDILVFTGEGQEVVPNDGVVGRVLFVVPFIGYFAG